MTITRWQSARTTLRSWRDEEIGEAAFALQLAQQVDDLCLHRKIKRRGRFIEQNEFWFQRNGAGNGDALALAAGKFMREARENIGRHAGVTQRLPHPSSRSAEFAPMSLTISPSSMIWRTTCAD